MTKTEYFNDLRQKLVAIQPTPMAFDFLERLNKSINIEENEDIYYFIQVVKDSIYDGLAVDSIVISKNSLSDIVIGVNSFRYHTCPINKIIKVQVEVSPIKNENQTNQNYLVKLLVYYGMHPQSFFINTSEKQLDNLLQFKERLLKFINK